MLIMITRNQKQQMHRSCYDSESKETINNIQIAMRITAFQV